MKFTSNSNKASFKDNSIVNNLTVTAVRLQESNSVFYAGFKFVNESGAEMTADWNFIVKKNSESDEPLFIYSEHLEPIFRQVNDDVIIEAESEEEFAKKVIAELKARVIGKKVSVARFDTEDIDDLGNSVVYHNHFSFNVDKFNDLVKQ